TLLQALAQSAGRQRRLARAGAIEALVTCVGARDKELVLRAASALAEFVGHEDGAAAARFRQRAAAAGILSVVASVLERDTDAVVVTVNANIARVYAQRTQFHGEMVRRGYLAALLRVARRAGADVELQRVVMESMVRLCTYLGGADTGTMQLEKLLQGGAADVVAACVRRDDQGVASWGIGLLHEFVSRGVGTLMLARRAGLVRALCRRLSTAKYAYTNQLVLRSLLCLGSASRVAMAEIAEPPNLRRILAVFAIEDADAHHWGIALVARAAAHVHTHVWILGSPLPRALRDMATRLPQSMRATLLPEIANIISRMCHSAALAPAHAAHDELAETCRLLMASDIENAHLAAIMAIINAAATSRAFVRLVVTDRVRVQLLDMLVDFSHDVTQSYAAKGLAALLPCALVSPDTLVFSGTVPFLQGVCTRYADALDMDSDGTLAGNENRAVNIGRTNAVASVLLSVMPIFLATETRDRGHALAAVRTDDAYVALFSFQACLLAHMALCAAADGERDHSSYSERFPECDSANISAFGRVHAQFALDRHAAGWRTAADLYACVEPAGHTHWVVDRSGPRGSGLDIEPTVVLRSLRQPLADGAQSPAPSRPSSSPAVDADDTHRSPRPPSPFPSPSADDTATPPLPSSLLPATQFHTYTPFYPSFIALADGHTIWNSSWKFESARTRTGVDGRLGGIHRFHVRLLTSGLIQIGWCSNKCGFYPESGEGVGDDYESIAYDGHRQRKWFGTAEDTKYGEKWHAGDVVTAELDLDNGRVVFYLNGRSMGLAFGINEQGVMEGAESGFQGLSRDRTWYPAFSFATEQGLVFLGDGADQQSQRLGVLPHIADS
ncbi:hypothetical protein GGF45_002882, partial [Coemansia sp. RSA 551]